MGSILPMAFQALQTFQAVSSVVGSFDNSAEKQSDLALRQLQQNQELNQAQASANATLRREELAVQTAAAEKDRRDALKRAVARQRVQFGASGIDTGGGGSSEAVLLGLFEESDDERIARERLDNIRLRSIDQGLSQSNNKNILARTQLTEKNKLKNAISPFEQLDKTTTALNNSNLFG